MNDFEENMIKKVNQNINTIFLKGIMAGFFIAIASMLSIVVNSSISNYSISKLLSALVFPIGLILVVLFKTELFTGNCLVIIPLINKKIKIKSSLKLLIFSYLGNLAGAIGTIILVSLTNHFDLFGSSILKVGLSKLNLSIINDFALGILCNILVCSAVYLANISKTIVEKVLCCIFPVFAFVLLGFEHSIANMYYLFATFFDNFDQISLIDVLNNLYFVTIGNIIGGFLIGYLINKTKSS